MYGKIEPTIMMDVPTFVEQMALVTARMLMRMQPTKHKSGLPVHDYVRSRGFVIDVLNLLKDQYNFDLSYTKIDVIKTRLCTVYKALPVFNKPTIEEFDQVIIEL